MAKQL
ncbi:hypothetical protein DERF_005941 [Dermatophagoides farinae]